MHLCVGRGEGVHKGACTPPPTCRAVGSKCRGTAGSRRRRTCQQARSRVTEYSLQLIQLETELATDSAMSSSQLPQVLRWGPLLYRLHQQVNKCEMVSVALTKSYLNSKKARWS